MLQWEQRQSTQPSTQQMDLQSIIAATTEAVLKTMSQMQVNAQTSNETQNNLQQQQGGANNSPDTNMNILGQEPEHPGMSFDSDWTDKPNDRDP